MIAQVPLQGWPMPAHQILALTSDSQEAVPFCPGTVLLSGAFVGGEVVVERYDLPPQELADVYLERHTLSIQLERPALFEHRQDGRWHTKVVAPGAVTVRSAGSSADVCWRQPVSMLGLSLSSVLLASAAADLAVPDRVELVYRCGVEDPQLAHVALALHAEVQAGYPLGKLYAESLGLALAVCLLQRYADSAPGPERPDASGLPARTLRRVSDYVLAHLDEPLGLERLASLAGLSPHHFCRQFKRSTGFSPHRWVLRQRVEQAKQLMREPQLTLAEIAFRVGFSSQSHLTTSFRHAVGVTPTQYRAGL
ncbi:MAG: helix-turn-helix transcriptional regulator [Gemmatimonadaceae bacterium]|nr:helix-turn-helix transcriptional regulator [Gloeobacterales cyanobacterium ES-bin-141]